MSRDPIMDKIKKRRLYDQAQFHLGALAAFGVPGETLFFFNLQTERLNRIEKAILRGVEECDSMDPLYLKDLLNRD
jgi:hypothetical protein